MTRKYTAPALPLTGAEYVMVMQVDPASGQYRPHQVRLSDILAIGAAAQATRDAARDAALALEGGARQTADAAEVGGRGSAVTARLLALEAKSEEVAHFVAAAKLPALSALGPVTLTLAGLVPAKAAEVLRDGETVQVEPATPLPAGVNLSAAVATANGTVSLQLTASLLIAAGSAPIIWNITALR